MLHASLRFALLVVVFGISYLFGLRGLSLILMSFLLSIVLSILVLRGPRSRFGTTWVMGFFHRMNDRLDAATRKEDYDGPLPGADSAEDTPTPAQPIDLTDGQHSEGGESPEVTLPKTSDAPSTADSPRRS